MSALSPWIGSSLTYSVMLLLQGTNPISLLEIVSALNSFNIAHYQYYYGYGISSEKYNLKVYLGAVQTASPGWNYDYQNGQNWNEKSGSCFIIYEINFNKIFRD